MKQTICFTIMILTGVYAMSEHKRKFGEIALIGSSNVKPIILTKTIYFDDFLSVNNSYATDSTTIYLLKLNPEDFYCKSNIIKRDFLKLIQYNEYPVINLKATLNYPTINYDCNTATIMLELTIADITNMYVAKCSLTENNKYLILNGRQTINITDFKLKPESKFFGFISFNNFVDIKFSFRVLTLQFSQK